MAPLHFDVAGSLAEIRGGHFLPVTDILIFLLKSAEIDQAAVKCLKAEEFRCLCSGCINLHACVFWVCMFLVAILRFTFGNFYLP